MRIVIVEDDDALRFACKTLLEKNGHKVDDFANAEELYEIIKAIDYDIFILDINLPQKDGFELFEELKPFYKKSDFIFISAYNDIDHILKGFELGAEDYIKKPFDISELMVRIKKIEKRRFQLKSSIIEISEHYKYDISTQTLYYNDEAEVFTKKESQVIYLLVSNINRVVDYETLKDYLWDKDDINNNTLNAIVMRLRKKLQDDFIQSVRSVGYTVKSVK